MLRPAAVSAAAAVVWLLTVLGPGLFYPAEATSETGFTHCSHSFYRQMAPQGASVGSLRPLCHTQPGGRSFATLYQPTCDSAVYSAFHLRNGLADSAREDVAEPVSKENEIIKVVVPALLKGHSDQSHSQLSPAASHFQQWDSTVTSLVQSNISPRCHTSGGDLYVLIGARRLGAITDEVEKCQTKLLWSAVCCAVPEGKGSFSKAFIRETEGEERKVSVEELQEMLGVTELFSGGCRGDMHTAEALTSQNKAPSAAEDIKTEEINLDNDDLTIDKESSETTEKESTQETVSSPKVQVPPEEKPDVVEPAKIDKVTSESDSEKMDVSNSGENESETQTLAEPLEGDTTVDEQETDTNSTSTFLYVLSTTLSILTAPLHPVVNKITQLPGQVTYVLQEDLGVLAALPGETFSLFHLMASDLLSWTGSAADLLLNVGETGFSNIYYCTSSMGEALLNSCYSGITGMGTLAGDTVGIFGEVLDNTWWVTKFFGGRLFEQSGDYVGSVVTELGGQAQAVGGGLKKLTWRSGNGVGHVFSMGGGIVMGIGDMIIGAVREAFGQESE